jgi:hypothetical protein
VSKAFASTDEDIYAFESDAELGGRREMTWDEIKVAVEKNNNVLTVAMETLRDAHGAEKLGVHVRAQIIAALAGMGLGHIPKDELPLYQHEPVRLYKKGSPVGDHIDKVLTPGQQHDQIIADKFTDKGPNYAAIVQKIKELVAD